jgi:hypothetical protein
MRTRIIITALGIATVIAGATGYGYVQSMRPQLELGVGYAARVACGCRFIGKRSLVDCGKDFETGMEPIQLTENSAAKSITASVPMIAQRTVRFDADLGCQPEPFAGTDLAIKH